MKTLTALVMTGAVALGACYPKVEGVAVGSRTHYSSVRFNGHTYHTRVTEMGTKQDVLAVSDRAGVSPYEVNGVTMRGSPASRSYGSGSIRYVKLGDGFTPVGCTWGGTRLAYEQCGAVQITAASRLLDAAADKSITPLGQR